MMVINSRDAEGIFNVRVERIDSGLDTRAMDRCSLVPASRDKNSSLNNFLKQFDSPFVLQAFSISFQNREQKRCQTGVNRVQTVTCLGHSVPRIPE